MQTQVTDSFTVVSKAGMYLLGTPLLLLLFMLTDSKRIPPVQQRVEVRKIRFKTAIKVVDVDHALQNMSVCVQGKSLCVVCNQTYNEIYLFNIGQYW